MLLINNLPPWVIFLVAAILEVGGDTLIRKGLNGCGRGIIILGFIMIGCYGLFVNKCTWDFSKMLGTYLAFFSAASLLAGLIIFKDPFSYRTLIGLVFITIGGLIIQYGAK